MKPRLNVWSGLLVVALGIGAYVGCAQVAPPPGGAASISLPAPALTGKMSLEEALAKRRSVRSFTTQGLTLQQVGQLAWAAQGITGEGGKRTAPSAMAVYPLQVYVVKHDGVFRYVPEGHKLAKVSGVDARAQLSGQPAVSGAAVDMVIIGDAAKARAKFADKGDRFMELEAGHIAQNILLQAVALGLGGVPVAGYRDDDVRKALGVGAQDLPLYIVSVGHPQAR